MDRERFYDALKKLALALGKGPLKPEVVDEYWSRFQRYTDAQWEEVCRVAGNTLERFPAPVGLYRIADELGYRPLWEAKKVQPIVNVICGKCGYGMVVSRSDLDQNPSQAYRCAGYLHAPCAVVFQTVDILSQVDTTGVADFRLAPRRNKPTVRVPPGDDLPF